MADFGIPPITCLLGPEDLATLVSLGMRQTYRDGETIREQGQDERSLGIVVSGRAKLMKRRRNGAQILESVILPGHYFGDFIALDEAWHTHTSVAIGDTVIDHYPRPAFDQLLEHPAILRALYKLATMRLFYTVDFLDDMRTLSTEVRLGKLLVALLPLRDKDGQIECLQEDLASRLGISGVTLAKALGSLKNFGLVETGYRQVTVPRTELLLQWLAEREQG